MTETLNVADEKSVKAREKKSLDAKEQLVSDVRWLLKQPQFRRYIWSLLGFTRMFKSSFVRNELEMAFYEGSRNVGIQIYEELSTADSQAFLNLIHENSKGAESNV